MFRLFGVSFIFLTAFHNIAKSQGCSDAGFCSIGAMHLLHTAQTDTVKGNNTIAVSMTIGSGEQGTMIYIPQVELSISINRKARIELHLPYYFASGNLGNNSGIGDPIISYTQTFRKASRFLFQGTGGLRIGTGNAAALNDKQLPLPMPYQSSLGTTDLIIGAYAATGKYLSIAAALQQPLFQYNENNYSPDMPNTGIKEYNDYFNSKKLKRKGDALLKLEGHYTWQAITAGVGPLFIYHLGNDKATDINGDERTIPGSEGLTINIAGSISYTTKKWKIDIAAGSPLVVRDTRPDGLTRSWVITPRITYGFK